MFVKQWELCLYSLNPTAGATSGGYWRVHDTELLSRSDANSPSTDSISFAMSHSSRYVYNNKIRSQSILSPQDVVFRSIFYALGV